MNDQRSSLSLTELTQYEILSSWWASFVWWGWGQDLVIAYFTWKTKRKYEAYLHWNEIINNAN